MHNEINFIIYSQLHVLNDIHHIFAKVSTIPYTFIYSRNVCKKIMKKCNFHLVLIPSS